MSGLGQAALAGGRVILCFAGYTAVLCTWDNSTYASNFTELIFSECQIPRRYAPGIIPLALRTSHSSFLASVIKIFLTYKTAFPILSPTKRKFLSSIKLDEFLDLKLSPTQQPTVLRLPA